MVRLLGGGDEGGRPRRGDGSTPRPALSAGDRRGRITSQDCYRLLEGWRRRAVQTGDIRDAHAGRDLTRTLRTQYAGTHLAPTSLFYDLVLECLAACDVNEAQHFLLTDIPNEELKTKGFNIVMNAWAKRGGYQSGIKAQELFEQLQDRSQEATLLRPDQRTMAILLEAWGKSGHPEASDRVMTLFRTIMDDRQRCLSATRNLGERRNPSHGRDGMGMDMVLFNSLLRALVSSFGNRWAAETCELVILELSSKSSSINCDTTLQPDTQSYSIALQAWAECESAERLGRAAQRAEDLLKQMVYLYSQHGSNVKPNARCFTTCIAAWSRAGRPQRAERLWQELVDLHDGSDDPDLAPDTAAGNAVLAAWARSGRREGGASAEVKRVLAMMQSVSEPNLVSYNCLLDAYSQDGLSADAVRLLKWLEGNATTAGSDRTVLAPDVVSYNTVLNALARDSTVASAEDASALLQRCHRDSSCTFTPDVVSFTAVIRAWGNCKAPSSLDRVVETFQHFLASNTAGSNCGVGENGKGPDKIILVAVVQAISNETVRFSEALHRLIQVLKVPKKHRVVWVDDMVFVAAISSCLELTAKGEETGRRNEWLKLIFSECCSQGFLSRRILDKLRRSVSRGDFEFISSSHAFHQHYTQEWSRRIHEKFRP